MKYETKMRCLRFVADTVEFEWLEEGVCDKATGKAGPSLPVIQQAIDEGLITVDLDARMRLTEKGSAALRPVKMRRLTFLVAEEHVIAINNMVMSYITEHMEK